MRILAILTLFFVFLIPGQANAQVRNCIVDNRPPAWTKGMVIVKPKIDCGEGYTIVAISGEIQRAPAHCRFFGLRCKPGAWTKTVKRSADGINKAKVRVVSTMKTGKYFYRVRIVASATGSEGSDRLITYSKPRLINGRR